LLETVIVPSNAPTFTVSPSLTEIFSKVPFERAGTSILTLSVSSSTTASSAFILSPSFFNHLATVASVTDYQVQELRYFQTLINFSNNLF